MRRFGTIEFRREDNDLGKAIHASFDARIASTASRLHAESEAREASDKFGKAEKEEEERVDSQFCRSPGSALASV